MKGSYLGVGRRVAMLLVALLIVAGGMIGPVLIAPQPVAAETLAKDVPLDVSNSGLDKHEADTDLAIVYEHESKWLMQTGSGALKVMDAADEDGAGGCVGSKDGANYYWPVTSGAWYEIRFLARNGGASNDQKLYFRVGSSMYGAELVSLQTIDAPNWEYYSFRFKGPGTGQIFPQWFTYNDEYGEYFYLDWVQLAQQPEEAVNNTFETDTSSWSCAYATLSRVSGGAAGTSYCLKAQGTSATYPITVFQGDLGVTSGQYYTLDCYVKAGNTDVKVELVTDYTLWSKTVSSTSWTHIQYNFRAPLTNLYVCFEGVSAGTNKYFYVDEVFLYSSRDELVAQINYRAYAMHQFVISQTTSTLVDRYDDPYGAYDDSTRALTSLMLGEIWFNYHDTGGLTTTKTLLNGVLDHNKDVGSSEDLWGDNWLTGTEIETLLFGAHWIWGELDDVNNPRRSTIFNVVTDELDDYLGTVYTYAKTSPGTSSGSYGGTYCRNLTAWDMDFPLGQTNVVSDTRAEDTSAWQAAIGYAAHLFTAASGNGYWSGRENAEKDAGDIALEVLADNVNVLTWDDYQLTHLQNYVTGTFKVANHGFYPNPWYTAAILKAHSTVAWGQDVLGETLDYEGFIYTGSQWRMASSLYVDNWNSTIMPDAGFDDLQAVCSWPQGCTWDGLNDKEVGHKYKLTFLPAWYYIYDDHEAMYEAQRVVRMLQDNHEWWPASIAKVDSSTWGNWSSEQRDSWWDDIRSSAENFSQYAARYYAMHAHKIGSLPTGNQFVADPLTW